MPGSWSSALIADKPADVYVPPGPASRFGVLYLHDLGQESLRDRPAFTRWFDALQLVCVCPRGGACWWTDRPCPEFDPQLTPERYLLDHVVRYVGGVWGIGPRQIGLLGVGMGGQGALRLAFKHPDRFPAVAAIAPAIEYHELYGQGTPLDAMYTSKEQCRQDTALLHVSPLKAPPHIFFCVDPDDAWYRGSDRLHEKLSALGVAHTRDLATRAGGHSWDYFDRMAEPAVRFVHAGLEQESRRLL
jgi:S-formylglutathione hydrolase